ncbi:hypothetical protein RUM43_009333 [Polyplax serrata]|uniref:GPI alpha-1,4-mannosyltransferase I, catalytic subunit n=1 Tax=Polyplax serrata TaxID=468196 RepID=A0AAN8NZI5_POLSC
MEAFAKSLLLGLIVRLVIIAYGEWHDRHMAVPFTDVDYKVFSDAARHVSEGSSPYKRHTYRYPPVLAWLLVPNIYFPYWGKALFSLLDVLISVVYFKLGETQSFTELTKLRCVQAWMFNPLAIIISTRGNSDSLISLTVLLSAYFLLKSKPVVAGFFLALSVHIRLYPIMFSLPMYLALKPDSVRGILNKIYPDRKQILFVLSCLFTLLFLTSLCYYLYGWEFLDESILYHLRRKDTRHNFSVYFYLLYLQPDQPSLLLFLPQFVLLLSLSFVHGRRSNLLFCMFAQAFIAVTYNPVITSQYFIWYLSLLVPNLPLFNVGVLEAVKLVAIWLFSQLAWLVPAYLLEFRGRNTFLFIWFQGVGFFCANLAVLVKLIKRYRVGGEKVANPKTN